VAQTAEARGLLPLAAAARLALAQIARAEHRDAQARELLVPLTTLAAASAEVREQASAELAVITDGAPLPTLAHDQLAARVLGIEWQLRRGERSAALALAVETTALAAAAGRSAELAVALAHQAVMHAAAGRPDAADEAAVRAISEGVPGGLDRQIARALIVRATLMRDGGSPEHGLELADAAHTIATTAGLSIESLVAATCAEACARQASDEAALVPLVARRRAAAAILATPARAAADALLADLGLSSDRPFRVAAAGGVVTYVATVDQAGLGVGTRSLVVDGAREVVVRDGTSVADLRRRSLLKKLLFLFAGAPGRVFSKEDIVRRVWGVDYHPLRHDAALFTNIMRLRRVIGADGETLLRATDGGYKLVPPADFLFIERVGA
jgi:hypothetical protein